MNIENNFSVGSGFGDVGIMRALDDMQDGAWPGGMPPTNARVSVIEAFIRKRLYTILPSSTAGHMKEDSSFEHEMCCLWQSVDKILDTERSFCRQKVHIIALFEQWLTECELDLG
jgi:hypothetical protein